MKSEAKLSSVIYKPMSEMVVLEVVDEDQPVPLQSFQGRDAVEGMIGFDALERARTWGYDDDKIKELLVEEKLGLGWKAAASLFGLKVE